MRFSKLVVVLGFGVLAAACSDGPVSPTGSVSPRFSATDNNGAIVIHEGGGCGQPGAAADGSITFGGIGQAETVVENGNKVMIKCKGNPILNLSGRGQSYDGFSCGWVAPSNGAPLFTTDTHATVSKSGVGTMTCTFDKPSAP